LLGLPDWFEEAREGLRPRALEFAILTAARTGEVIGATWAEIDLQGRLWIIPGKRQAASTVYPSAKAVARLLVGLDPRGDGARLFPVSNMAMLMLLRRMGRGDLTVHGFRSTFSDWCAERTTFPSEVREITLAHAFGDKVEAAYRRGDLFEKRRQLAEAWATFCGGEPTGNIIRLQAPAA